MGVRWQFPARPFSVAIRRDSNFPTQYLTGEPCEGGWQPALFCQIYGEWFYNPDGQANYDPPVSS